MHGCLWAVSLGVALHGCARAASLHGFPLHGQAAHPGILWLPCNGKAGPAGTWVGGGQAPQAPNVPGIGCCLLFRRRPPTTLSAAGQTTAGKLKLPSPHSSKPRQGLYNPMQAAANYSLSSWTDDTEEAESSGGDARTAFYMTLYASLAASSLVFQASGASSGLSKGGSGDKKVKRGQGGQTVGCTRMVCESRGSTAATARWRHAGCPPAWVAGLLTAGF